MTVAQSEAAKRRSANPEYLQKLKDAKARETPEVKNVRLAQLRRAADWRRQPK